MIVGAVVAIASTVFGAVSGSQAAKGQLQVAKANREASEVTRKARNEYEGAATALSNYIRSSNNNQLMKSAGANYNAIAQNIGRLSDQAQKGKLTDRIAATEALGSMTAAAAAIGVGGSTVDMMNSTFQRATTISNQARDEQEELRLYDLYDNKSNVMSNAVAQMDQGQSNANIDSNKAISPYIARPSVAGAVVSGLATALPYIQQFASNWGNKSPTGAGTGGATAFGSGTFSGGTPVQGVGLGSKVSVGANIKI